MQYVNIVPPENSLAENKFILTINENGRSVSSGAQVFVHNKKIMLPAGVIDKLHIKYDKNQIEDGMVDLEKLKSVKVNLNSQKLELDITVPSAWLPTQHPVITDSWTSKFYSTNVTPGFVLDYNIYGEQPEGARYLSTWVNGRYYNHLGYLNVSGQYTTSTSYGQTFSSFRRMNTSIVVNNRQKADKTILGDIQSSSDSGFTGVYMGGVQFSKDYSLRPDLITYPSVSLNGTAATPSTLDFFVNGYQRTETKVGSGPYVINNIPFINGDGTMTVVTTDQTGQKTLTTIPFNVQTDMLRSGLSDYNFSLGGLRYNYGQADERYRNLAFSGTYRHGLTDNATMIYHVDQTRNLTGVGSGVQYNMNKLGRIDVTLGGSRQGNDSGLREYINYSKNFPSATLNITHVHSDSAYKELANYASDYNQAETSDQIFYSQTLKNNLGYVGTGIIELHSGCGRRQTIANVSYSTTFRNNITLALSYSREISQIHSESTMLSISLPVGNAVSFSQEVVHSGRNNDYISSLSENSQSVLGVDWNLNYEADNSFSMQQNYKNISAYWKNAHSTIGGGAYGYQILSPWESVTGSMVVMDHSIFFSRELGNAFAKVDTSGIAGVPFYLNGSPKGYTDSHGIGFISDIVPYQKNEITISPEHLPQNIVPEKTESQVFLPEESGYTVKFPVENMANMLIIRVHDTSGKSPPPSSAIENTSGRTIGWTGYSGIAELPSNDGSVNHFYRIQYGNGRSCSFNTTGIHDAGIHSVTCSSTR